MIWSRQGCPSEETQFPIATPATCGPHRKTVQLCVQGRAVTTLMEQSACGLEAELASLLVSSVTLCQTVSGPYCLRRPLEHHVPVPKRTRIGVCLNGAEAWRPARTWAGLSSSFGCRICLGCSRLVDPPSHRRLRRHSPQVYRSAVTGEETAGQDYGRSCVCGTSPWLLQHLQPSRCSFGSCLRRRHVWVSLPHSFTPCHNPHGGGV